MEPEELGAVITLHAEGLTKEKLGTITKVSEENAGSDEEEEVSRTKLTVKFLGEKV